MVWQHLDLVSNKTPNIQAKLTMRSFYLGKILVMIGYTDTYTKTMINLGNTACMRSPFFNPDRFNISPKIYHFPRNNL
jgi:hypothetical protein